MFQAMETFFINFMRTMFDKGIENSTPRHADRAFDNTDLFFFTVDVRLFIRQICVTLVCRDKACPHLYAIHAKCQSPIHIGTVIDPACQHDRYIFVAVRFDFSYHGQDFFYFLCIGLIRKHFQLFPVKAQMSACFWSFDHQQIRHNIVFSFPDPQHHFGRFFCGNDRCDLRVAAFYIFREFFRKPCPGNDQIRPGFYSSLHVICIIFCGNHDIKSDDSAACKCSCLCKLGLYGTQIRFFWMFFKIWLSKSDLCGRKDTDTAICRHTACQMRKTDPNTHSALNHRNPCS